MKRKRISIKWRIFLSMIGFCVVLLGILWTLQIVFLESFYKIVKIMEVRAEALTIGEYITENHWDLLMQNYSARDDVYVEVWSLDYGTVLGVGNYEEGIQLKMNPQEKVALFLELREKDGSILKPYQLEEVSGFRKRISESIMYSDILVDGSSQTWMLMVSSNVSPVTATVNTLRYQIYTISAVMLCFAVLIALTLSRRIIRPIVRLNTAAGELARGNYDATFQADGYREIGKLADTLSHAATELGKTETLRKELIANVSHDLRTPLTLITGYSEMMRDIPGENTPENMQVIIDESKRLTSLVNDLLDLSKLQASMTAPDFQLFNITASVREILARLSRFTEKDGYTLRLEAEEDVCVLADKGRLTQVIYNLLTNAVNYTGEDKTVTVRQILGDGRVTIQIIDTGVGIDPDNLPYVWDRYFKVDKVHKRAVTGTGLGLSIVKNILTQHPGVEYGVQSEVGKGSNFWFSMPIAAPEETEFPALPGE